MDQATVIDQRLKMPRASWSTMLVLGAVTVLTLCFVTLFALPYFTLDQQRFGAYWPRRGWLLIHIVGGIVTLLVGPAQLWLGLTHQRLKLHRQLGAGYMTSVGISAIAALYLSSTPTLGGSSAWG